MIPLHRLKGDEFFLNHRLIETVEGLADTVITLTTEKKLLVKEKPAEIIELIQQFEQKILTYVPSVQTITKQDAGNQR